MKKEKWKVGDLFVVKDTENRYFNSQVIVIKKIRYIKDPKTGGITVYKIDRIIEEPGLGFKRLCQKGYGGFAEDVCEKIMEGD